MRWIKESPDITGGTIWKQVILFFIPILVGAFFQHLYAIVDTIIVGRGLGTLELSAVGGSASKLIAMITNFFIGVSIGITAYASRYAGKKDYRMMKSISFNGLLIFTVIGFAVSVLCFVFTDEFLRFMKTPSETMALSKVYLQTYLIGIVFCVIYNALAGILRAIGDAKRPLYVLIFCSFMNILLDLLFALVMGMGVFGVAIATVLSQTISAVILGMILLKSLKGTEQYKPKIEVAVIKQVLALGIPAGMQSMMYSLSNMVIQSGVNSFGATSVAAWTTYVRVNSVLDMFVSSLGGTAITFVGQNYGAGNMKRVRQSVKQIIMIGFLFVLSISGLFVLFRYGILSVFTKDPEVINYGISVMFAILPMYVFAIPKEIFSQALRGLGNSFIPMLLTLVGVVGIRFFWVYEVLPRYRSLYVLGLSYPVSSFVMFVVFYIYYKYELRKEKYLEQLKLVDNGF